MGTIYHPPTSCDPLPGLPVRRPKKQRVRIKLPMSIRCDTCENYICEGTKFSSRKEEVIGKTYLGVRRFRFCFKCTKCSAEIAIKTYPQDPHYVVESGATRMLENEKRKEEADDDDEMGAVVNFMKKRKFSEEFPDKPTDSVTKATTSGISNDGGNSVGSLDRGGSKEICANLQN